MTTESALIERARTELSDFETPFHVSALADGVSVRYTFPSPAASLQVSVDGVAQLEGTNYVVDIRSGVITFQPGSIPAAGDEVVVTGTSFRYFRDAEWITFLSEGFQRHVVGRPEIQTYGHLSVLEEPLVVYQAVIQALWVLIADVASDIAIYTPEGMSIPRPQRLQQLTALLQQYEARYRDLAQQLNVGLWRVEVLRIRRVSRSTGRLVPIYRSQEIEQRDPPVRVWPPIDDPVIG